MQLPYMSIPVDETLVELSVLGITARAAHFSLILVAWKQWPSPMPDDDKFLARWCGLSTRQWRTAREELLTAQIWRVENDEWINDDLAENFAATMAKVEANRANGKKGGRPKKTTVKSHNGFLNPMQESSEPAKSLKSKESAKPNGYDSVSQYNNNINKPPISPNEENQADRVRRSARRIKSGGPPSGVNLAQGNLMLPLAGGLPRGPIPTDWQPSSETVALIVANLSCTESEALETALQFKNQSLAKRGPGCFSDDWDRDFIDSLPRVDEGATRDERKIGNV